MLGAFAYTVNETVLHTDERFLPRRRRRARGLELPLDDCAPEGSTPTMTYSSTGCSASEDEEYCVTLNRGREIDEDRVIRRFDYTHPRYTLRRLAAQARAAGAQRARDAPAFCRRVAGVRLPRGRPRVGRARGAGLGSPA